MEHSPASLAGTRICYAITKDSWGGAQAYVYALARGAKERGADVSVLVGSSGAAHTSATLSGRLREAGIPVAFLSHMQRDIGLLSEWHAFRELVSALRKERPHVLHLNSSKMGALGSLAGRVAGVPRIVFTAHGWPHREPRTLVWKAAAWCGSLFAVLLSHRVIAVSECDLRTAPSLFMRSKVVRVYNGAPSFELRSREEARAALVERAPGLSEYPTWILMNAELHPNKGIDTAIRAVSEVVRTYPHAALVIQGAGEEQERLEALARELDMHDRVFLADFVPEARRNLRAADIFLMPSRKEGLPLALLEAGAAGVPAIVSAVGGMPEIVEHGKTGLLISPDDVHALARALSQLLANPEHAQSLGKELRARVSRTFSEARMLEETLSLYA